MKTIAYANFKGGVGKTTTAKETGCCLAQMGKQVLLIDVDPQANLTRSLLGNTYSGLYEALTGQPWKLWEVNKKLMVLSSSIRLSGLEKTLVAELDAYTRLSELLTQPEFAAFDLILIDTPPSLGILTVNALTAADCFIIPMNPSLYSMQGTNDLLDAAAKVRKNLNPKLNFLGVIINAYDSIPLITRQIKDEIAESFQDKLFSTMISRTIRIEEAIANKTGVAKCKAAEEIKQICEELLQRLGG